MSEYQRAKTETATQGSIPFVTNCDSCPRVNASYSSTTVGTSNADTLISTIGQLHDLQREVRELQAASKKTLSFYDSTSKLNKTVQIVIIILMVIPVIQLLLCAGVVYFLGIEDELPGLINWILGSVSILSILELIVGGIKLYLYEKRMDELEKKIDAMSNTKDT